MTDKYPCILRSHELHAEIDPAIQHDWHVTYGTVKVPFGDLRRQWKQQHCRTLNPYGSEDCPYPDDECLRAFMSCVRLVTQIRRRSPIGYFRVVAKMEAARRADEKPHAAPRPSHAADTTQGVTPGQWLSRATARPVSIGDVLRALDLRSRARAADARQASAERPSPPRDPV